MFDPKVTNILKNNNYIDTAYNFGMNKINTSFYNRRVDYVFTKYINLKSYLVDENNKLSDHYPILVNY